MMHRPQAGPAARGGTVPSPAPSSSCLSRISSSLPPPARSCTRHHSGSALRQSKGGATRPGPVLPASLLEPAPCAPRCDIGRSIRARPLRRAAIGSPDPNPPPPFLPSARPSWRARHRRASRRTPHPSWCILVSSDHPALFAPLSSSSQSHVLCDRDRGPGASRRWLIIFLSLLLALNPPGSPSNPSQISLVST